MKKFNLKFYLAFVAIAFGAFVFSACKQNIKLMFNSQQITMGTNEELEIKSLISLQGTTVDKITFVSSAPEIVAVTPRQTIIAGDSEGVAILTATGFKGFLEITVKGTATEFSAPTNLHYDQNLQSVVWDNVYAENIVANNFKVVLTDATGTTAEHIVNTNSFKIEDYGKFDVAVMCMSRGNVKASGFSSTLSFTKLSAPKNLVYNSITGILSWDSDDDVQAFYIKKDGVLTDIITNNYYNLELDEEKTYKISVVSTLEGASENVYGTQSDELVLTRLTAPTINVNGSQILWQDSQQGVSAYRLYLYKVTNDTEDLIDSSYIAYSGSNYSYNLTGLQAGEYKVRINALGDSELSNTYDSSKQYIDSAVSDSGNIEKLEKPTLLFDKSLSEFSVLNFDAQQNLNLQLYVYFNGQETQQIDLSDSGTTTYSFDDAGTYTFTLVSKSTNASQIDSDASTEIQVLKLGQISSISQGLDINGNYTIGGLILNGANQFVVEKIFNDVKTTLQNNNGTYGFADEVFASAGDYQINITASGTDSANKYIISSTTTLNVKRLASATLQDDGTKIYWDSVALGHNVLYEYELTGASELSGSTTNTYFDYMALPAGMYTLKVYSTSTTSGDSRNLILDAFDYSSINFESFIQIATPDLNVTRSQTGYTLNITPSDNANRYIVMVNGVELDTIDHTSTDTICVALDDAINGKGVGDNLQTYNVAVVAKNISNTYYTQSEQAQVKLEKISVATDFTVAQDETVSVDKPHTYISSCQIFVNDEQTNALNANEKTFNVKVKYISDMERHDNCYYLDSDFAEFALTRTTVDITVKGLVVYWSTQETSQRYLAKLNLQQSDIKYSLNINDIASVDLSIINSLNLGFDMNLGITGYVDVNFGAFSGEISGSYQNGKFVSGVDGVLSKYLINGKSSVTTLKNADSQIGINVGEQDANITVQWTGKQDANYVLFDGTAEHTGLTENRVVLSSADYQNTSKSYVMSLTEQYEQTRNVYIIYVTRLNTIENLTINADETLTATPVLGAEKAVITKDGSIFESLSGVGTSVCEVKAKYVALSNVNSYTFYLDSAETTYNFARLAKLDMVGNFSIYNDVISWKKENLATDVSYSYNVKFYDNLASEQIITFSLTNETTIDLSLPKYRQIISALGEQKYVSIQKYVGSVVADNEKINYLTSEYSDSALLKVIKQATNLAIKVLDDDLIEQRALEIYWTQDTTGVEVSKYVLSITHNGQTTEIETTGAYTVTKESNLFKDSGVWQVMVKAVGANDSISSTFGEKLSVLRLAVSGSLTLNKNGVISWGGVDSANEYKIVYSYINSDGATVTNYVVVEKDKTSSSLFEDCLNDTFSGEIALTLYALGDGTTTLTSVKSATFSRLQAPQITVNTDRIVFENYDTYPTGTTIFVSGTIDGKTVLNSEITVEKDENNKYVWFLATEFSYTEDGQLVKIDTSSQKTLQLSFTARNQGATYINSNVSTCEVVILSQITNLRFVRKDDGIIHLLADNNNTNVNNSTLKVGEFERTYTGNIDLALTDNILTWFDTSWRVEIVANGKYQDGVYYINSKTSVITGTKLSKVTTIGTNLGAVEWNSVLGAVDYKLKIDETIFRTNYKTILKETLSGSAISSGDHILAVKAIGNVTQTEVSDNIVLDSDYSADYTVTKLPSLSDFTVKNGYFTFTEIQNASQYVIKVYEDLSANELAEYNLQVATDIPAQESVTYYQNLQLLSLLDQKSVLYVKVFVKTEQENYVYSDFAMIEFESETADYIKVSKLVNASPEIELYHPTNPDETSLDYATTIARWEQNTLTNNGYVLKVDDNLEIITENNYTLDSNQDWAVGVHNISYRQLGSNGLLSDRLALLSADYSQQTTVTKLNPTQVYLGYTPTTIKELCVSYKTVAGANKYYAYVEDKFFKEYGNTTANLAIMMDGLETGKVYNSFGMRAVSTVNINYIASNMSYMTLEQSDGTEVIVKLSKLITPKQPTFKDGAFYWELSDSAWQNILISFISSGDAYIKDPFETFLSKIDSQDVVVKFVSKLSSSTVYTYSAKLNNFVYMSDTQRDTLCSKVDTLGSLLGMTDDQKTQAKAAIVELQKMLKGGFSSAQFGFNKFAQNLPVGEYNVSIKMASQLVLAYSNGDLEAKFSSEFVNIGEKYVCGGPTVTAVATDGKYTLEFDNINVDANYFSQGPTYKLIGLKFDKDTFKTSEVELATITATGVNDSQKMSFDLSDLIDNNILDSTYIQIYVTVKGNNSNVFNGKPSNIISIDILDPIEAKVEHGQIKWQAQEYVSKYQITYVESGLTAKEILDFSVVEGLQWYDWDSAELAENKTYNVTLQACGFINTRINNSETFRMSGALTSIGKVTKLANISNVENGVDIVNGIFTWDAIANATSYDIFYTTTKGSNFNITSTLENNFETIVTDTKLYYYYFMAVGTEEQNLNSESSIFVNSKISECNLAQRVGIIDKISFEDGIIKFTPSQGYKTGYYKLTFYKLDSQDARGDKIVVYTTDTTYDTNINSALLAYGKYDLEIQALYSGKQQVNTNPNAYYVISYTNKNNGVASTNYVKFDAVTDIQVKQGRISWTFNNDGGVNSSDYLFRLEFTSANKDKVIKTVLSDRTFFEDVVYDEILTTDNITLNVYVWAVDGTAVNYVKSVATEYLNIHQYEKVDETKIEISTTENSQLMVDWSKGVKNELSEGFKYEISFSANGKEEKFYTSQPTFITGEGNDISFNIEGEYTIVLRIRVIPMIDNYISSAWTENKEISRPKSISGLSYDFDACVLTWDAYPSSDNWSSYKYKIKDEVTFVNADGELVTQVYILTASIGDEKFEPFVIGTHTISIAVMVSNSESDNFISEYVTLENISYNLFESGDGSESNPYLIANTDQFVSIKYRASKDAKNNEYFFGTVEEGVINLDAEKTTSASTQYYFKQTSNIELAKNATVDNTLCTMTDDFANIYDGDYYSLTLNYTHIDQSTDFANVSIFGNLASSAVVKNLQLMFNMSTTEKQGVFYGNGGAVANINLLCKQNKGTITNIKIGADGQTISLISYDLVVYLSFVTYSNSGTISNVMNYYNVSITDKYLSNQQSIQYASIAINNQGVIENAKNVGTIQIKGSNIIVGGLVALNKNGAIIRAGANSGKLDIYYNQTATSYVGGLVAKNDNGELEYCYCTSEFVINSASTCTANVGGLVGWSVGDKIYYSYVNISYTQKIQDFNIYQVVGLLTSAQTKATNVYYKNIEGFAGVNGTYGSGFKTYSLLPTEDGVNIYGEDTKFNKTDIDGLGNPKLNFEAEFDNLSWK